MATYNGSITTGGVAQWVGSFNASTSISITNGGADPIIFGWDGCPNGIAVLGTTVIDAVSNNSGLWPIFSAVPLSVWAPRSGQVFSINYV